MSFSPLSLATIVSMEIAKQIVANPQRWSDKRSLFESMEETLRPVNVIGCKPLILLSGLKYITRFNTSYFGWNDEKIHLYNIKTASSKVMNFPGIYEVEHNDMTPYLYIKRRQNGVESCGIMIYDPISNEVSYREINALIGAEVKFVNMVIIAKINGALFLVGAPTNGDKIYSLTPIPEGYKSAATRNGKLVPYSSTSILIDDVVTPILGFPGMATGCKLVFSTAKEDNWLLYNGKIIVADRVPGYGPIQIGGITVNGSKVMVRNPATDLNIQFDNVITYGVSPTCLLQRCGNDVRVIDASSGKQVGYISNTPLATAIQKSITLTHSFIIHQVADNPCRYTCYQYSGKILFENSLNDTFIKAINGLHIEQRRDKCMSCIIEPGIQSAMSLTRIIDMFITKK